MSFAGVSHGDFHEVFANPRTCPSFMTSECAFSFLGSGHFLKESLLLAQLIVFFFQLSFFAYIFLVFFFLQLNPKMLAQRTQNLAPSSQNFGPSPKTSAPSTQNIGPAPSLPISLCSPYLFSACFPTNPMHSMEEMTHWERKGVLLHSCVGQVGPFSRRLANIFGIWANVLGT